jgi:hypothetical protein
MDCNDTFEYKRKTQTVRSDISIILSLIILIVIEMLFVVRFASQREKSLLKSVL